MNVPGCGMTAEVPVEEAAVEECTKRGTDAEGTTNEVSTIT